MKKAIFVLAILGFVIGIITSTTGESSTCLALYKEGGAAAVFQSPECPTWNLLEHDSHRGTVAGRCQSATRQGRRSHLEDRTFCNLDMRVPALGNIHVLLIWFFTLYMLYLF